MGEIRTYIDPETGERFTGEVLEEYTPTEKDKREQEKYIRKYNQKMFSNPQKKRYLLKRHKRR